MDCDRSVVFDQAENRMHVQKAILLLLLGGRHGPLEFEECQCLKKLCSHIPAASIPPSSFPG